MKINQCFKKNKYFEKVKRALCVMGAVMIALFYFDEKGCGICHFSPLYDTIIVSF